MSILTTSIQHFTDDASQGNKEKGREKEIQGIQIIKEKGKLSLFTHHMLIYGEKS